VQPSERSQDAAAQARRDVVQDWLRRLDPEKKRWDEDLSPVVMTVVDALLHADAATLQAIGEPARDALADLFDDAPHAREARGYLLAVLAMARWGLERLPDPSDVQLVRDSHAWRLLEALEGREPLSSSDLRARLGTSDSQVSRTGRQLLAYGLVNQRRAGRTAVWELTPRGRQLLEHDGDRHSSAR
jgi:hypothetical protein